MSLRFFVFSAFALGTVILSGCASDGQNNNSTPPEKERVSTIPWNKPASWEGQGSLGGMGLGGAGSRY